MNDQTQTINVTQDNLQVVLQQSTDKPVLLFIGDSSCGAHLADLEALALSYQGKLTLANIDAEKESMLARQLLSQLQATALPAQVLLHEGRPVEVLSGPQTEEKFRSILDPVTMSPVERIRQQVETLMAEGDTEQALVLLQQILQEEPDNHGLQVLQVNLLLETGRIEDARQLISALPDDAQGIAQPKAKLAFYELLADAPDRKTLEANLAEDENDHESRYQLAIRLVTADQEEQALEHLLIIVRRNREFREDGARLLMLKVFEQLGAGNSVAKRYRGKLFGLMH